MKSNWLILFVGRAGNRGISRWICEIAFFLADEFLETI